SPERSPPCTAEKASPPCSTLGASPLPSSSSSLCMDIWRLAISRRNVLSLSSPFGPSSVGAGSKRMCAPRLLLRPLLTSRAAAGIATPAARFQARGEISPGKNDGLPRTAAGSTPLRFGRESFAFHCTLALLGSASYPVSVRRLDGF